MGIVKCSFMGDVSGSGRAGHLRHLTKRPLKLCHTHKPFLRTPMSFSYIIPRNLKCSPPAGSFLHQCQAASRLAPRPTPSVRLFGTFGKRESGRVVQSLDKRVFSFPLISASKGFTPFFASFKRGIVTDSQAIVTRPTGRDAWIRYAVVGVGVASLHFLPSLRLTNMSY